MLLLRTRSAIRTHTVRALNAVPPAVGLPGHAVDVVRPLWTTSVSNRAGAVCKTALHTCASPERASEEARTPSSGLRIRCATCRAALACEPATGVEPALDGPSDRCLLPLGYEGMTLGAEDSNLHELLQRQPCCRVTSAPKRAGRQSRPPARISAWRGRPMSERAGWSAAASAPRPASGRPCADCCRHRRPPCSATCSSHPAPRGRMWSTVVATPPQYPQRCPSRAMTPGRDHDGPPV